MNLSINNDINYPSGYSLKLNNLDLDYKSMEIKTNSAILNYLLSTVFLFK